MNFFGVTFSESLSVSQIVSAVLVMTISIVSLVVLRMRFLALGVKDRAAGAGRWTVRILIVLAAESLLLMALAGPERGTREEVIVRQGMDIMVLVDVSRSMLAQDALPSRLEVAKRKVHDLMTAMRGERMALVPFAGSAFVQCPLTSDYDALKLFLELLTVDLLPRGGSNLGEALTVALGSIKETPDEKRRGSAILILSDGEDLGGAVESVVDEAAKLGVRIFSIGIGSDAGAPIPLDDGGFQKDDAGKMVITKRDSSGLEKIVAKTKGGYWPVSLADTDVQGFRKAIGDGGKGNSSEERRTVGRPVFQYFAFTALMLLLVEGSMLLFPLRKNGKSAKKSVHLRETASSSASVILMITSALVTRSAVASTVEAQKAFDGGKFDEAAKLYNDASGAYGAVAPEGQYNTGVAAFKAGRLEEAEKAFERATAAESKNLKAKAWYNRGVVAAKRGDLEKATEAMKTALSFDPDDKEARENLEALDKAKQQKKQQQKPQQGDKDKENSDKDNQSQQQSQDKGEEQKSDSENKDQQKGQDTSEDDKKADQDKGKQGQDKQDSKDGGQSTAEQKAKDEEAQNKDEQNSQQAQSAQQASQDKSKRMREQQIDRILEGIPDRGDAKWYAPTDPNKKSAKSNRVEKDW